MFSYKLLFFLVSFRYSYQALSDEFGEKDRVRVIVRIRPINEHEKQQASQEIISCDRSSLIVEGKSQSRKFQFNTVFDPNSIQEEMFNYSGIKRLINMAIDGYIQGLRSKPIEFNFA
jgi:hypothetical protein